jgi:hypothetical protein
MMKPAIIRTTFSGDQPRFRQVCRAVAVCVIELPVIAMISMWGGKNRDSSFDKPNHLHVRPKALK